MIFATAMWMMYDSPTTWHVGSNAMKITLGIHIYVDQYENMSCSNWHAQHLMSVYKTRDLMSKFPLHTIKLWDLVLKGQRQSVFVWWSLFIFHKENALLDEKLFFLKNFGRLDYFKEEKKNSKQLYNKSLYLST